MTDWKACDVCGVPSSPKNPVLRFGLRRTLIAKVGGRWQTRAHAAGGLDLCRECWERYAAPRQQPHKGRPRGVWPPVQMGAPRDG